MKYSTKSNQQISCPNVITCTQQCKNLARCIEYNGKDNLPTDEEYVGVIAQELQKIAPFMVSEYQGEDGETYLAVDPSAFDFILVNAVKELNDKIDELESNNENLTAKLDQVLLESKLSKKGK